MIWKKPTRARKCHYFDGVRSLCGKYKADDSALPENELVHPMRCPTCSKNVMERKRELREAAHPPRSTIHADGTPIVDVYLRHRTDGINEWVVPSCPFCGYQHVHGAGTRQDDPYRFLGYRIAHCMEQATQRVKGYLIRSRRGTL